MEEVPHHPIEDPAYPAEAHDLLPFLGFPCNRQVEWTGENQAVEGLCHAHWGELYGHRLEALCGHLGVPCGLSLGLCDQLVDLGGQRGPDGHCQEAFGQQVGPCYSLGMADWAWMNFLGLQILVVQLHL